MVQGNFTNGLTPAEAERIYLLMEECGEVVQICAKILRHGYGSVNPKKRDGRTNRTELERELGHVFNATNMLHKAGDMNKGMVAHFMEEKARGINQYLHFNEVLPGGKVEV